MRWRRSSLFLHVHTLIRYDLLAENLRLFDRELRTRVPRDEDQERCRQLLANVEFVQYWTQDRKPFRHSRIFKIVVVVMLVVIPISVFLATQISFLRYQDAFVTYVVHMGCLALDLLALAYFWYRQARRQRDWRPLPWRANAAVLARAGGFYAAVFAFAVTYLGIAPVDSTTTGRGAKWNFRLGWNVHPLDSGTCRLLGWGCRYLRLDHRLLVAEKPDGEVLFKLRTGDGDAKSCSSASRRFS
ncbi:MAG: hypothetical protein HWD60_08240 [Defluviicoccus sp.]|nr:MAG: hypothetical protein HWD60_08240 [Defluviicoccus sp.]